MRPPLSISASSPFDDPERPRAAAGFAADSPFDELRVAGTHRVKQVWAMGGGKGGVGKSLIASSLSLALARLGYETIAIDLDLGGANLHTTLGVDLPGQSLSDFVSGRTDRLSDCLVPTGLPRLSLISGAQDAVSAGNITHTQKTRLLQGISELSADYIVIDLGAGSSLHTLDFFLYADIGLVTLLPEPTSIENCYRFIKSAYFRRLAIAPTLHSMRDLIVEGVDAKNARGIRSPTDLYREISRLSPESAMRMREELHRFSPKLIVNQTRTQPDIDIGFSVKTVVKRYFGIEIDYIGYLDYDSAVWQAVRRKRPLMLEFPNSRLVANLDRMAQFLVKRHGQQRSGLY